MNVCPKCGAVATDDSQAFCLIDGTPLVPQVHGEPTVVISRTEPTVSVERPRKRRTGLWIALAIIGILVLGGLVGLLMFAAYKMGSESASVKSNAVNGSSPRPTGTPRSSPQTTQAAVETTAPTPGISPDQTSAADEPTPITWTTAASTFKTETGLTYTFECPPGGTAGIAWGSDVYTADSSICTAAVHAGKINLKDGGEVTIEFVAGRQTYGATTRNGITSNNYGQYPHSFVFK